MRKIKLYSVERRAGKRSASRHFQPGRTPVGAPVGSLINGAVMLFGPRWDENGRLQPIEVDNDEFYL